MNLRNISDFTDKEYKQQAQHKNFSMIANIMSGVNFSSNKVLYTIYNENITSFERTETVANITALKTDYHGGSSNLNGVIFNNIKLYVGGNNISLIDKKGDMGARLNPVCAAPRYNAIKKSKLFDLFFRKEDCNIIPRYEGDNCKLEYKFMLFILPILLVNGNEGMGSGHAQKILPRNIFDIINYIKYSLGYISEKPELNVYYNGFEGNIEQREENNQWKITGSIRRVSNTKTEIYEVPVNETYNSIIKTLNTLIDKKIIRRYDDLCDTREDKFKFIIYHSDWSELSDDKIIEDKLKLVFNVSENYTVIDENNILVVYNNVFELFDHFIKVRLDYYNKRKQYIIKQMEEDLLILRNKVNFIAGVNSGFIELNNKRKTELEFKLYDSYYDKVDDSYDYLLGMKIYSLTIEKQEELKKERDELEKKLEDYKNKDIKEIWLEELEELEQALPKPTKKKSKEPKKSSIKEQSKSEENQIPAVEEVPEPTKLTNPYKKMNELMDLF